MLSQVLAILLLIILVNSFKRLTMGIKARYTSWGLFILVVNGFLFFRMPEVLGWDFFEEYADWERLAAYTVALGLNIYDWFVYEKMTRENKEVPVNGHE